MSRRARPLLGLLALLLSLGGCFSGFSSKSPPTQVYLLRPSLPSAPSAGAAALDSVMVLLPQAPAGLASDGIAVLRSGGRLDYYRAARWAGTTPEMLQSLAMDALRATHRFALAQSDTGAFASGYVLSLELHDFEAVYTDAGAPTIHVELICSFGKRSDRGVLASFTAESEVRADADRLQSVVAAFDLASAQVLAQMAANLTQAAAAAGAH